MSLAKSAALIAFLCFVCVCHAQITLAGAGYTAPTQLGVAPGQVITLFVTGSLTMLPADTPFQQANGFPLPTAVADFSVQLVQQPQNTTTALPILLVEQFNICSDNARATDCTVTAITVQLPYDLKVPNPAQLGPVAQSAQLTIIENGTASRSFRIAPVLENVHFATTCDAVRHNREEQNCKPLVVHGNGSMVTSSSPARIGEELALYAFGLGTTSPIVAAGQPSPSPAAITAGRFVVQFDYMIPAAGGSLQPPNAAPPLSPFFSGLTPGFAGLYQVNFAVERPIVGAAQCADTAGGANVTLTLRGLQSGSSDQARICVDVDATSATPTAVLPAPRGQAAAPGAAGAAGAFTPNTIGYPVGADLTSLARVY